MKTQSHNTTIEDAISTAFSIIEDLANEVREVVDNAADTNFASTQRIQTLEETADTLENTDEPTVPPGLHALEVTVVTFVKRRQSRADRRDEACAYLAAVIELLQEREDDAEAEELAGELENIQGEWDGAEFPGMYG